VHVGWERHPMLAFSAWPSDAASKAPSISGLSSWWQRGEVHMRAGMLAF